MRKAGGASTSSTAPKIMATVPPTPKTPCDGNFASATKNPSESTSKAAPTQLMGSTDKADSPSSSEIAPATPGRNRPGDENSTYSPKTPATSRMKPRFGSAMDE